MGNLFNMEGGLMSVLSKIFDICYLSILWTICCIPVVTAGAATTALYYSVVKVLRRERGYLTKEFFRSFKLNFINGTVVWVLTLLAAAILYLNMNYANAIGGNTGFILLCIYRTMFFVILCTSIYVYPNLSRFTIGKIKLVQTSFFMAMRHLPTTIVIAALIVVSGIIIWIIPIFLLILPAIVGLLASFLMERVLKKYMPKKGESEDSSTDEWYLE